MQRALLILTFFTIGCSTPSKLSTTNPIAERNKDILILSTLIRDYLKQTNGRDFGLSELRETDTLKRISTNFDLIELKSKGGYISVYYRLSKSRDKENIELTDKEKELLLWNNWTEKKSDEQYDGEIRFDYGERFYHIKKFVIEKE